VEFSPYIVDWCFYFFETQDYEATAPQQFISPTQPKVYTSNQKRGKEN
jgi:hypothetical protein